MNPIQVVQNNVKNWQKHDADAIAAAYAEGGAYLSPISKEPVSGQVVALWAMAGGFSGYRAAPVTPPSVHGD